MTTQEQLKIFAAYLPYNLEFEDYGILRGIREWIGMSLVFDTKTGSVNMPIGTVKPILYDLSHLTKEIEHEGEIFKPVDLLVKYAGNQEIGSWLYNYNYDKKFNLNTTPYLVVKKLLEWHFNVFGIPAGDFIEKSTLKTENK